MRKKIKYAIACLLIMLMGIAKVSAQPMILPALASPAVSIANFNPQYLANFEVQMWRAYYARNYVGLTLALIHILHEQFQLNAFEAAVISLEATRAASLFAAMPQKSSKAEYEKKILPTLIIFYRQLKMIFGGNWDPVQVANAELDWWVARRNMKQNKPEQIGTDIAKLYALLYGKNNADIERAGLLRAQAAYLRTRQSRRGKIDWEHIQQLLEQSYRYLLLGITDPHTMQNKIRHK